MKTTITRRNFLQQSTLLAAGSLALGQAGLFGAAKGANAKVLIGIIGCNGRGMNHITSYLSLPNVEIASVCEVASRAVERGLAAVAKKQTRQGKGEKVLRRILED